MLYRAVLSIQIIFLVFAASAEAGGLIRMQENRAKQRKAYIEAVKQRAAVERQQAINQQVGQQIMTQRQMILQQRALQQQQLAYQQALRSGEPESYLRPVGQHSSDTYVSHGDTLRLKDIAKKLEVNSEMWPMILDPSIKEILVSQYIEWFRVQGVIINKDAKHYVDFIDGFTSNNKKSLQQPFKNLVKIAAIMEYDFDNGQNKDMVARQYLGEQLYQSNKTRLGMP